MSESESESRSKRSKPRAVRRERGGLRSSLATLVVAIGSSLLLQGVAQAHEVISFSPDITFELGAGMVEAALDAIQMPEPQIGLGLLMGCMMLGWLISPFRSGSPRSMRNAVRRAGEWPGLDEG